MALRYDTTETMTVLVTVKAYPTVSTRYGEAVCVAGVRVDREPHEWVRLFPVPFRDLPEHQRFSKYQFINVRAAKHNTDRRRETWRPDLDSIELGDKLPTGGSWTARRRFLEPFVGPTMCQLNHGRQGGADAPSLGIIKPLKINGIKVRNEEPWSAGQLGTVAQGNLLTTKPELVKPDHAFSYHYCCEEPGCPGHKQKIVDWELGESYRSWRRTGEDRVDAIRGKWLDTMCAEDVDTYFFVGDQHTRPGKFLVLGTFWPKRRLDENQMTLQLAA